jgi:predicted O-methyltransferase YrrM
MAYFFLGSLHSEEAENTQMVQYNLSHLTQAADQNVWGPIQDDEALLLYSVVKGMRMNRALEIGGMHGYSARNFLAAMDQVQGLLYTVDLHPVPKLAENHRVIVKNALALTPADLDNVPIDLIFFDCHDLIQMDIYNRLYEQGIITDKTVLALHDTNLHYAPYQRFGTYVGEEGGYAHQPVERDMVNRFKDMGYDVFCLHTTKDKHSDAFPFRHGVTLCQKFVRFH